MSKVFIEETTLTAIGEAIRAKTGKEELIAPLDMPTEIESIETGGGGAEIPDDFFLVTGDCSYRFSNNNMNYLLETEPYKNMWRTQNITKASYLFSGSSNLKEVPFSLNLAKGTASSPTNIDGVFQNCKYLEELPELETEVYVNGFANTFSYCRRIREIPQSWYDNIKFDYIHNQKYPSCSTVFQSCHSLRKIDSNFIKNLRGHNDTSSASGAIYYGGFNACYVLDEIVGVPTVGIQTSNVFNSTFAQCNRVKDIIFDTNEDGTAKTAKWKSQTIDLSSHIGWTNNKTNITNYNSGITEADLINNNTHSYAPDAIAAMEANPNWFTDVYSYSRYNLDSAVNTINSLPDTSAYLAANGGTNTIKFKAQAGNGIDKAINGLTEAEIAVATAKGWTVTLV